MEVSAVCALVGVLVVAVVVALAHLIPAVQHGDAALSKHPGVEHQITPHSPGLGHGIAGGLQPAQGGGGATQPGVPQPGVVVVQLAPADAAGPLASEPLVQISLVGYLVSAEAGVEPGVVQAPADVIVAAQVVEEQKLLGQSAHGVQLAAQQGYIAGGQGVPGGSHGGDVVEHVTLGFFGAPEVGYHLGRLHDHLPQQQHAGADNFAGQSHQPHHSVHHGQVAATGAQLLPDVGHSIQPNDVNAPVGQVQQILSHVVHDHGVCIVQVPLIGVEGGHHHLLAILQPGEVAGGCGGEHLGHRLLIPVGNVPVVVEEVALPVARLPCPGLFGPLVVLAGVVHHKVQAQAGALGSAGISQSLQVLHGAQLGLHRAEVRHGIAAVAAPFGAQQQRHQVQVVHSTLVEVAQLLLHPLEGTAESVGVQHHAYKVLGLKPLWVLLPLGILLVQGLFPAQEHPVQHGHKVLIGLLVVGVDGIVQCPQLLLALVQTALEDTLVCNPSRRDGCSSDVFLHHSRGAASLGSHRVVLLFV